MKNPLSHNAILYSIGEILPKGVSLILLPIFANYLSPDDFGILNYTVSLNLLLTKNAM